MTVSRRKTKAAVVTPLAPAGSRTIEALNHFRCKACNKWWAIGDAPLSKVEWFCPWCGQEQEFKKIWTVKSQRKR